MAAAAVMLLCFSAALRGAAAGGEVPLVAWSTASGLWSGPTAPPLPAAGHLLEDHQLGALLEPALTRGPRTVLLVLHDELSVEDFTAFGGVHGDSADSAFPRLQAALAAAGSVLQLAAVPGGAVGLPHTLGAEPLLADGAVGRLKAANGTGGALLLRLPHSAHRSHLMSPREMLARNDEALGEVLSALQAEGLPYSAVLTALRPSRVPPKSSPHSPWVGAVGVGGGRALLQAPNSASPRMGGGAEEPPSVPPPLRWPPPPAPPKVLLWAENISVELRGGGGRWDLTPRTFGAAADVDLGGSKWDPEEARLVLRYRDVAGGPLSITLVLQQRWFAVSARRWFWLAAAEIRGGGGGEGGVSTAPPPTVSRFVGGGGAGAPLGWSWRCQEVGGPGEFLSATDPPGPWAISIIGMQVQPFNVSGFRFGGANDCSGFVSGGAVMGLLLGALLTAVAAQGGALLLRLRPMDRFDDPRAPPLHVAPGD